MAKRKRKKGKRNKTKLNVARNLRFNDASNEKHMPFAARKLEQPCPQPYLMIYESEIQQIAGHAASYGEVETGGTLFGLFSHADRLVIMLATGPGPDAIHEEFSFCDDIDFLIKAMAFMRNNYGLNYIGNHHSHHFLSVKGLSRRDIQSTHSIALKNGYSRLCQIVLTFEEEASDAFSDRNRNAYHNLAMDKSTESIFPRRRKNSDKFNITPSYQANFIKMHAFIYLDAKQGLPLRCRIKVIPGISPIRQALERNNAMPELIKPYSYPISHIIFDSIKQETRIERSENSFPTRLTKQYLRLPNTVREKIEVVFKEGFITLSLPTPDYEGKLFVAYSTESPHKAAGVYFMRNVELDSLINFTSKALCFGPYTSLQTIFKRATNLIRAMKPNSDGTNQWKWLTAVNHPKAIKGSKSFQ